MIELFGGHYFLLHIPYRLCITRYPYLTDIIVALFSMGSMVWDFNVLLSPDKLSLGQALRVAKAPGQSHRAAPRLSMDLPPSDLHAYLPYGLEKGPCMVHFIHIDVRICCIFLMQLVHPRFHKLLQFLHIVHSYTMSQYDAKSLDGPDIPKSHEG